MDSLILLPTFSSTQVYGIVNSLSYTEKHILERILELCHYFGNKKDTCYFTQQYVGDVGGYSRSFTNQVIKKLSALGLILKVRRGLKETCLYEVNSIFEDDFVQMSLRKLLPVMNKIRSVMKGVFALFNYADSYRKSLWSKSGKSPLGNSIIVSSILYKTSTRCFKSLSRVSSQIEIKTETLVNDIKSCGGRIQRVMGCELTDWGQVKLMAYPEEVVKYVDRSIKYAGTLNNPMAYFEQACRKQCESRGVKPDYGLVFRMRSALGYTDDSPVFNGKPVSRVSTVPQPQGVVRAKPVLESEDQRRARLLRAKERNKAHLENLSQKRVQAVVEIKRSSGPVKSMMSPEYWAEMLGLKGVV